jgi:hypothetical protein
MAKLIPFIFFTVMVFTVLSSVGSGNSITQKIKSGVIRTIATALSLIVVLSLIKFGAIICFWSLLTWLFSSNIDN